MNNVLLMSNRLQYWQKVKRMFGANLIGYWPFWETSGTVAQDYSGNGRNGAYSGVTLGQTGIGDGKKSAYLDGSGNDYINIYSPELSAAFNPQELTLVLWGAAANDTVWTDSTFRTLAMLQTDSQNRAYIRVNNGFDFGYIANNVTKSIDTGWYGTSFFQTAITASKSLDNFSAYLNGVPVKTAQTGLGLWAGVLNSGLTLLGASDKAGARVWLGNECHAFLLNRAATASEIRKVFTLAWGDAKFLGVLGDSISAATRSWASILDGQYNNAHLAVMNHAVAGQTIISNMDAQTVASASDNADIIIIALGTNDDNAGDMTALRAEYGENIAELQASNPRATIYAMNVLPRWTNNTGATPVDKSNIRGAISAECSARGITCWDTYTVPWITAADTSDGVHPTAAGHAKIAAEVLARLP